MYHFYKRCNNVYMTQLEPKSKVLTTGTIPCDFNFPSSASVVAATS